MFFVGSGLTFRQRIIAQYLLFNNSIINKSVQNSIRFFTYLYCLVDDDDDGCFTCF